MITLAGGIWKGFLGEVLFSWTEGCVGFSQEVAGRGPACLIPASIHRWPMALGDPILVLIWDLPPSGGTIFLGVAEPLSGRLEKQAERTEGKRRPGREDWVEKAGEWRKG